MNLNSLTDHQRELANQLLFMSVSCELVEKTQAGYRVPIDTVIAHCEDMAQALVDAFTFINHGLSSYEQEDRATATPAPTPVSAPANPLPPEEAGMDIEEVIAHTIAHRLPPPFGSAKTAALSAQWRPRMRFQLPRAMQELYSVRARRERLQRRFGHEGEWRLVPGSPDWSGHDGLQGQEPSPTCGGKHHV